MAMSINDKVAEGFREVVETGNDLLESRLKRLNDRQQALCLWYLIGYCYLDENFWRGLELAIQEEEEKLHLPCLGQLIE